MPKSFAAARRSPTTPLDPDDLTRAIEAELAALAEVAADYAQELQHLASEPTPARVRQHRAKQIEALHRHDREPHVQRLAKLHQQMMTLTAFSPSCAHCTDRTTGSHPSRRTEMGELLCGSQKTAERWRLLRYRTLPPAIPFADATD